MPLHPTVRQLLVVLSISALAALPAAAIDEPLRALRSAKIGVETGPQPDIDLEAPPSAYPLKPVEQIAFRGARHGLVNTTTGTLAFQTLDLRLPGRMPIEMTRVFDTAISLFMPPPPPQQQTEPRWTYDLGKNWILGYAAYLVPIGGGVIQATPEGDLIWWNESGGVFSRQNDVPTKHWKLQRAAPPLQSTVIYETQLDGSKWTYTWQTIAGGTAYALTKVEDRSGNTITVTYNQGYISKIENSDGAYVDVFRPIYDVNYPTTIFPRHRVTKLTDSTGRIVRFDFDAAGLLTKVTDARGKDWNFTYAWDDKVATATDPLGNVYLNATYDSQHRVATYEADAGTWTFNYAAGTNQTSVTDAYGKVWIYTRDAGSGITTGVLEPEGGSYQLVLDSARNPISYTGPEGESIAWTYNADHRPLTYRPETSPTATITYTYNAANGWVDSVTNLSGGQTIYTRDAKGRVTQEQDPAGGKTTATYSDATGTKGDRLTMRLPLGNNPGPSGYLYTFGHDTYGHINSITDPAGGVFETDYDNRGNVWKVRKPDHLDANQQIVKSEWIYLYDAQGRLTSATDPLNNTWTRTFDDAGRLVAIDGPAGTKRRYTWDAKFRLTGVTVYEDGSNDPTTTLTYDNAGRIATKTTPGGGVWNYAYDDSGRRIEVRDPLNRTWTYTRDLSGRITDVVYPGGRTVSIDRYSSGLVQQRTYPHGLVENFTYDSAGRVTLARMQDTGAGVEGQVEYTYDTMGRPNWAKTSTVDAGFGFNRELSFLYDLNGNRTSTAVDFYGAENVIYTYDTLDRIVSADRGATYGKTTVIYDPTSGRRSEVNYRFPPSATSPTRWDRYFYDIAGRMNGRQWQALDGSGNVAWTLDGEGRFTAESDSVSGAQKNLVYGFQGLPTQVTSAVSGTTTVTDLTYDAEGLLSQRSETIGSDPASVTSYTWDAARRLNAVYNGLTGVTYTWTDAPASDLGAAFSVWRSQGNAEDRMLDIRYGYDGLLRKILTYHPQEPGEGKVAIENFWAPTEAPVAFVARERKPDDTIGTKQYYLDAGGYYGYGNSATLVDPVQLDDNARLALTHWSGAPMPLVDAGFRIDWPNVLRASSGEYGEALSGLASSMPIERDLVSGTRQVSPTSLASIGYHAAVPPPQVDFSDAWINGTLTREKQPSDYDVLGMSTGGVSGLSSSEITPDERQEARIPAWMKPKPGEEGVQVDLCEGVTWQFGLGEAPACNALLSASWLSHAGSCEGGQPDTDTGQSNSLRNPDLSIGGVSLQTGEFVTEVTDATVWDPAGPISFTRTYRSNVRVEGGLGHRWFHDYEESVKTIRATSCLPARKRWIMSDGNGIDFFHDSANNRYTAGPDAPFQIRYAGGRWEIRSYDGTVRRFAVAGTDVQAKLSEVDDGQRVVRIYRQGSGRVDHVTSQPVGGVEVTRLTFTYTTVPGDGNVPATDLLSTVTADGRITTYTYNSCRELKSVTSPATQLGYGPDGTIDATLYTPRTEYEYTNPGTAGFDCRRSEGTAHKLTKIRQNFADPLKQTPESLKTVLVNAYELQIVGGQTPVNYNGVSRQYLPRDTGVTSPCSRGECAGDPPDLTYQVNWVSRPEINSQGRRVDVVDHRLKKRGLTNQNDESRPDVLTRYDYEGNSKLLSLTEDYGGLARKTEYGYDGQGLRSLVKEPDGRCTRYAYSHVGGSYLVGMARQQSAVQCATGTFGTDDLVTTYDYAPIRGVVRSVTRPEAYAPGAGDVKNYTTYYSYDFDQSKSTPALTAMQAYCTDWVITCPPADTGLSNGDSSDDDRWSGQLIRTRLWQDDGDGTGIWLDTTRASQASGRVTREEGPDGVTTLYAYYSNGAPGTVTPPNPAAGNWDWRTSAGTSASGLGPLAKVHVVATDDSTTLPAKLFAWNSRAELVTSKDVQGVRTEYTRQNDGSVTRELTCKPDIESTAVCIPGTTNHFVLNGTHTTRDLWGRNVRTAVLDEAVLQSEPNTTTGARRVTWTTYDTRGNVDTVTRDPNRSATPGSLTFSKGAWLHLLTKSYHDGMGQVIATRSPEGRVACVTYDALGQPKSSTRYDNMVAATVDAACPAPGAGDSTSYVEYDKVGRVFRTTDGCGTYIYNWYDRYGRPTFVSNGQVTDADAVTPTLWDPGLLPGTAATRFKQVTYSAAGAPIRTRLSGWNGVDASGFLSVSWTSYDNLRRVKGQYARLLDPGLVPATTANAIAVPDVDEPGLAGMEVAYDNHGKVQYRRIRKNGGGYRQSETVYDLFGRPWKEFGPLLNGNRDGVVLEYDSFGRPWRSTRSYYDPSSTSHDEVTTSGFDSWGRRTKTTSEVGLHDAITTVKLDGLSRTVETVQRWDDPTSPSDPAGAQDKATSLVLDNADRVKSTTQRITGSPVTSATSTFAFSDDGQLLSLTDAEGNRTEWEYTGTVGTTLKGGRGLLRRMLYPIESTHQGVVRYEAYDGNGNALDIRHRADDNGSADAIRWIHTYDVFNRLTSRTATLENLLDNDPAFSGTLSQTLVYDDRGLLVKAVDVTPAGSPTDVVAEFSYNAGGLVTEERQYFSGSPTNIRQVTSTYNREAFRTGLSYPVSWTSAGTALDRYALTYAQDGLGRLASITGPADSLEPNAGVTRTTATLASYGWAGGNLWDRKYDQNGADFRLYTGTRGAPGTMLVDSVGRVTGIRTVDSMAGGEPIVTDVRYGYNRVGDRTWEQRRHEAMTTGFRTRAFIPDQAGRLDELRVGDVTTADLDGDDPASMISAVAGGNRTGLENWTLDSVGNWTSKITDSGAGESTESFTPNNLNQLVELNGPNGTKLFEFDWLGQMRRNDDRGQKMVWDAFGRLTEVRNTSNALVASYRYDALNRRVEKYVPSGPISTDVTTRFIYDGWKIIEERTTGAGSQLEKVRARYGYGLSLSEVLWMDRDAPRAGGTGALDPVTGVTNDTIELRAYLHADALGSVIAVTDKQRIGSVPTSINVLERFDYSGYGRRTQHTGAWTCSGTCGYTTSVVDGPSLTSLPIGYTGHYWDRETGLWYARNRYYDDRQGRFIRRDPIGTAGGANLYGYAGSQPIARSDPLGLVATAMQSWADQMWRTHQSNPARASVPWGRDSSRQTDYEAWQSGHAATTTRGLATGPEGCGGCEASGYREVPLPREPGDEVESAFVVGEEGHEAAAEAADARDAAAVSGSPPGSYPRESEVTASHKLPDGSVVNFYSNGKASRIDTAGQKTPYTDYRVLVEVIRPLIENARSIARQEFDRWGLPSVRVLAVDYLDLERNFERPWWGTTTSEFGQIRLGVRLTATISASQYLRRLKYAIAHESLETALNRNKQFSGNPHATATVLEILVVGREGALLDPAYVMSRANEAWDAGFPPEILGPISQMAMMPEAGIPNPTIPGGF